MPQVENQTSGEYRFIAPGYDGRDVPAGYHERHWTVYDDPDAIAKWKTKYAEWAAAIKQMPAGWKRDRQVEFYEAGRPTDERTVLICCTVY